MKTICFVLFLMCVSGMSYAQGYVYLGAYTRHMVPDKDQNEDNHVRAVEFIGNTGASIGGGTFVNSFGTNSWFYSIGKVNRYDKLTVGTYLFYVGGYEDHVRTMYNGYILTPAVKVGYSYLNTVVLPGVVSVGIQLPFSL